MHGSVERMLGYPINDLLENVRMSYMELMHEDDRKRAASQVKAAISSGKAWDVAYRLKHANGDYVPVRERGSAVSENGEVTHLQGLVVGAEAETALQNDLQQMLSESEAKSAEILGVTSQIARSFQHLNMLSINAGIEAARSGDAGKGFAVVAGQIKTLVNENGQWAGKIRDLINRTEKRTSV
jgi:PAS domain S-box-containing protein